MHKYMYMYTEIYGKIFIYCVCVLGGGWGLDPIKSF